MHLNLGYFVYFHLEMQKIIKKFRRQHFRHIHRMHRNNLKRDIQLMQWNIQNILHKNIQTWLNIINKITMVNHHTVRHGTMADVETGTLINIAYHTPLSQIYMLSLALQLSNKVYQSVLHFGAISFPLNTTALTVSASTLLQNVKIF